MPAELPLHGLRVVDTASHMGELAGRLLGDLGAEVLRIEAPGGDPSRRLPPFHEETGLFFLVRNLNKTSVEIDLSSDSGLDSFEELLAGADIWLDASPPGTKHPGSDPAAAVERLPRLIAVSMSGFGRSGPYRDYAVSDPVVGALSGLLFRAGVPELPPVLPPGTLAYDIGGIVGAFAALTAYWQRRVTGRGQHIDLSVMEACAQTTDWGLTSYSFISKMGVYSEIRNGGGPIYNIYPCRDGYVRASVVTRREWHKMRNWLGEPEFLQDPHWDNSANRIESRDLIEPLYAQLFRDGTMADLSEEGQERGLGITPLLTPSDVLAESHFEALGSFRPLTMRGSVRGRVPSGFFTFDQDRMGGGEADRSTPAEVFEGWSGTSQTPDPSPIGTGVSQDAGLPYAGLRVLDFGVAGAAPEVARLLAEYGAESIRVESRLRPDLFRVLMGSEMSPTFAGSNRSKQSFGADFRRARGIALIKQLIRHSDVLVENLPPGTMAGIGLDWEEVHRVNPGLIMFSSQLMGPSGRWRDWRGYGANTQPVGGLTHLWSYPGMPPVGANVAFPDHVVGRLGAVAVVAALLERERTGLGRHIQIAQVEVVLNLLGDLYLKESLEPGSVGPRGNTSDIGSPWGVYPCSGDQRWCVITCRDDTDWLGLVEAMGAPSWMSDPVLTTVDGRREASDRIDAAIAKWTAARPDREVMETLQARGVPAGRMMYISDEPSEPQLAARDFIRRVEQTGLGEIIFDGPAFVGPDLPPVVLTEAPGLGQHTRRICTELLGLSPAAVEELIESGVLYEPL